MFKRAILLIIVIMICVPAHGAQRDISGNYEASVMGSVMTARIEQDGDALQGVAHVYTGGKKNTYHFTGTINGNRFQASHNSGHIFSGNVTSRGDLVGVLKTRGGHRISVNAARR
ncbi:MAG: hypothetical protein HY912_15045 [Desulfomonile tiedjei]|uniref:DUF5666 domain-containing protein n=1 Tax=Desulfomonile tiedjei TaxID=2358 RepID=A0A9D6V2C6_9BACT|nr:hypothetical protein [Desulfomonile tiedjei]